MFQLTGKVAALETLQDGYAILRLHREGAGLLGPEIKVLVPPLVVVRDGHPAAGQRVEIGAQSMAETGMSRREPDCLLVARYIWDESVSGAQHPEGEHQSAEAPVRRSGQES